MKHVIIGTAGHVDHGKTLLIKALTGVDTDRLAEEKKRGITIELGFAHLELSDGTQAGIVDVPGHEKFIKNMLAGAGGIDLAMLVVAADEGFMPQTIEHMNILTLLGIQEGIVVLTKKDLVEPEWLEMMEEEIRERVKGTFLADAQIQPVSAYTGEGLDELREKLQQMVSRVQEKSTRIPFRLPIDRVFSVDGFGTVITGTLIEGCMREGDPVELTPTGTESRIRNLQVHGRDVETAYAGQRVAVNLAGLKKNDVNRGDILVYPGSVRLSRMIDVRLQNLPDSQRVITNHMKVHLYHGSAVMLAKVVLLDRDSLHPGESGYAQLRMGESLASKKGDRFVIRFYSPLETIGGGVILDDAPDSHKRNDPQVLQALEIKENGSSADRVIQAISELGAALPTAAQLAAQLGEEAEALTGELHELTQTGAVLEPLPGRYVAGAVLDRFGSDCNALLSRYHEQNPLHAGMQAAELRQKLFGRLEQAAADALLRALVREGSIRKVAERYAMAEFEVRLSKRQSAIRESLLDSYKKAGVEPVDLSEVLSSFPQKDRDECKRVLDSVLSTGMLVMLTPQLCYDRETYDHVCQVAAAHFQENETITLAQLRDLLGTSRKYALAILEYFDRNGLTKKEGDYRKLLQKLV